MNKFHRILSAVTVLAMCASLASVSALALDLPELNILEDVVEAVDEEEESVEEDVDSSLAEETIEVPEVSAAPISETETAQTQETAVVLDSAASGIPVDAQHFPDDIFRTYVDENFDTTDDDILSETEIALVVYMDCSSYEIESLEGIEYFSLLETLYCYDNNLSKLDVSSCSKLSYLYCYDNTLRKLDIIGCSALAELDCSNNELSALNLNGCTSLNKLEVCGNMDLASLDVSMCKALTYLDCEETALTSLDVSKCVALETLFCQYINLEELNVSGCSTLKKLYCDSNKLTELDLTGCTALERLYCGRNSLTELDVSGCPSLYYLSCHNNKLQSLDIANCAELYTIYCYNNKLAALDASGCTALAYLYCYYNNLTSLNISDCEALYLLQVQNNRLPSLDLSNCPLLMYLDCQNNRLAGLDISLCESLGTCLAGKQEHDYTFTGSAPFSINMATLVGEEYTANIHSTLGCEYDADTGYLSMSHLLSSVRYTCNLGYEGWDITVQLNVTYPDGITTVPGGICGDSLLWVLENGVLTIEGTGAMDGYGRGDYPWSEYSDSVQKIVLEEGVTSVGAYAFEGLSAATNVTISVSMSSIGNSAFSDMDALNSTVYNGTETQWQEISIGSGNDILWNTCQFGRKIQFVTEDGMTWTLDGDTLTVSGIGAMANLKDEMDSPIYPYRNAVRKIIIGSGVTHIGALSFCGTSVEEIEIADSVTSIGKYAFMNCKDLESVTIPGTVKTIDSYAFCECDGLVSVELKDGVTSVGTYAFSYCDSIRVLYLPASLKAISNYTFYSSENEVEQIHYSGYAYQWEALSIGKGNESLENADVEYIDHNYTSVITAPTCEAEGYTTHTCTVCGKSYVDNKTTALGHKTELRNSAKATCTKGGYTGDYVCTVCGKTTAYGQEIEATGHTKVTDAAVAPTCTTTGLTEGSHCSVCKEVLVVQTVVSATGHTWDKGQLVESSGCTADGKMLYTCTACGATKTEVLTHEGHTAVKDAAVAATCTATGLTEGSHCSVCGETLVAQEVVAALGHKYKGAVTAPTCTERGYTTYTCTTCGDSYTADYVEAAGHTWGNWVETKAATSTLPGEERRDCSACGSYETRETEALGNDDLGDLTGDGEVNVLDLIRLMKYVLGTVDTVSGVTDFTGNGHTDILDVIRLARHLADPSIPLVANRS